MACLKATVTGSLLTGPDVGQQRGRGGGAADRGERGAGAPAGLVAAARSG